jgi:hypothetical protein
MAKSTDVVRVLTRAIDRFPDAVKNASFTSIQGGGYKQPSYETAIDVPNTLRVNYSTTEVDGSSVQRGDFKLMMFVSSLNQAPTSGSQVVWDSVPVTVVNVDLDPTGAVYILQVRAV